MKLVRKAFGKDKEVPPWTIHGWACALVLSKGIERIGNGEITGPNLKKALESMKNLDTGGITPPITFSPTNHMGAKGVKLFKANLEKKYFEPITDWIYPK